MSKEEDRAQAVAKRAAIRNAKLQEKEKDAAIKEAARVKKALKIMSVPINIKKTAEYYVMLAYTKRSGSNMEPIQLTKGRGY